LKIQLQGKHYKYQFYKIRRKEVIQKYLIPGVRLKWNAPAATQQSLDGAIVDNRGVASSMIYDGLDGELINPATMMTNVTSLGFTMRMPIQHV
jgi:hypothetical protein